MIASAFLALFLAAGCGTVNIPADDPDYFPMTRGVRWTYEAHTEVCQEGGRIATNDIVVSCEVMETVARGGTTVAHLSGFPLAMNVWSEGTNLTGEVLLVCIPASQYHLLDASALARFQDPEDFLLGLFDEDSLVLDCPLVVGKRFGEFDQLARPDLSYFWYVTLEEQSRLRGIRGISSWRRYRSYHLIYRTLPAVLHVVFVPGVGIVEYTYHHNGTPCDVRMRLKEFQKPN
jgi:hypothetical protein